LLLPQVLTKKNRDKIMEKLRVEYCKNVFGGKINPTVTWSNRLSTTAGLTRLKKKGSARTSSIELSGKVISKVGRLRSTLMHELCHSAQWELDGNKAPSHGEVFMKWREKAQETYPGVRVSKTHDYEIEYKYNYRCVNAFCGKVIGRQRPSIDVEKKRCGACLGKLVLEELEKPDTPKKPQTEYQRFVAAKSKSVKDMLTAWNKGKKVNQQDVMREIGELWKVEKRKRKEEKEKSKSPTKMAATVTSAEAATAVDSESDSDEDELLSMSLMDRLKLRK
jgi:predicted SprT family Zn-dependent metalloprotease